MRLTRKFGVGLVATFAVGGAVIATRRASSSTSPPVKELTSDEFNALFDQKAAKKLLTEVRRLKGPGLPQQIPVLRLYRLLGCPYCARVKMVLDFCRIPYEEVLIDPLSGNGLKDKRYPYAPQLELLDGAQAAAAAATQNPTADTTTTPAEGAAMGVFVVNSSDIIRLIAEVCRFDKDLTKPQVVATRQWLSDRFQGVTFAVLAQSWWSAYYAYPALVPERYRNVFFQTIGATALYGLCRLKITPRLKAQQIEGIEKTDQAATESADAWLMREAAPFSKHLLNKQSYHGGKQPDIVDVEMFGVLSTVVAHPVVGPALQRNYSQKPLLQWYRDMQLRAASEQPWQY